MIKFLGPQLHKKLIVVLILVQLPFVHFSQIVADHTVVDQYLNIPLLYIDEVKKMLVDIAGESHSSGYRIGLNLLQLMDQNFQVLTFDGTRPAYSDQYLRLGRHGTLGEAHFYTNQEAIDNYKSHITSQYSTGNPYSVMGFGWCWDMTWQNPPGGTEDPVFNVRWAGSSVGGPEGSLRWGLDSGDSALTGNSVSMDTYLDAVNQYTQYCIDMSYSTKVIFTTGPVDEDSGTETGFQREIKHDYIRDYVAADESRILFDYADILCWSDNGEKNLSDWNDDGTIRSHINIHPDNMMDYDDSWNLIGQTKDGDHIGEVGALRLGKAMWWMLARIAGWDGGITVIPVTGIVVTSAGGKTNIAQGKSLQFSAMVSPSDASNSNVSWSVTAGTGNATINSDGLLTAGDPGTVTIAASAVDGSGIKGIFELNIESATGINITVQDNDITLYPNPGSGLFYLEAGDQQVDLLKIVSPDGTVLMEIVPETGAPVIELNLSKLNAGLVFIKAYLKDQNVVKRAIIFR